jgi:hypothetical protein
LKYGSLNLLEPSRPVKGCNGIALPLPLNTAATRAPETPNTFDTKIYSITPRITLI